MSDDALEVFQQLLDEQCRAILAGDLDAHRRLLALPHRRKFTNDTFLIETDEEVREEFTTFRATMQSLGMNSFIRLATAADFMGAGYLTGHYVTHAFRNATPLFDSFESLMTFARTDDGHWAMIEQEANIQVYGWPVDMVRRPFTTEPLPMFGDDDSRRSAMSALSIYQDYLDATARTVSAGDFDGYSDLMEFPYTAHGSEMDQVVETPEALHPFYEVLRRCHNGIIGDRIDRVAERAEFIAGDQICGYHSATVYDGDEVSVQPVYSCMVLRRTGTRWRLQSVNNSISNREYPFSMYQPGGSRRTHLEIQKRTKQ